MLAPFYNEKMTSVHATAIGMCFLMNMCDGLSVMIISYTAPSIIKEWQAEAGKFGIVFSAGLTGMALGSIFLSSLADKIGRKSMIILCAAGMGTCITLTAFTHTLIHLIVLRFVSGLFSMLSYTSALASEYAPNRSKAFWISFVMSGYPIGAVLCGLLSVFLTPVFGWESTFLVSGLLILLTPALLYLFLPESLAFLFTKRPKNALEKANRILSKMKLQHLADLPAIETGISKSELSSLLGKKYKRDTVLLWVAFFLSFTTLYFLTSWIPKLAADAGSSLTLAIIAGLLFNLGAFGGIITQGYLSVRFGLRRVICTFLIFTALLMFFFSSYAGSSQVLILFSLIGFGIQGGFIGLYAVAAKIYSTDIRATGIGWAIGLGRMGAIIGPLAGGLMIINGLTIQHIFLLFSIPLIIAGFITLLISSETQQP